MAVNPYFNNNAYKASQDLVNDLVKESIRIHGINCFYMPRELKNFDSIFGEDTSAKFKYAFPIEVYLETPFVVLKVIIGFSLVQVFAGSVSRLDTTETKKP